MKKLIATLIILTLSCQIHKEDSDLKQILLNNLHATWQANYELLSPETDTEVAFSKIGDTLYVDFEGSLSGTDWKYNMMFGMVKYANFYAHGGFIEKWISVENSVWVNIIAADVKNIVFRGFSQGAAIAQVAYADYIRFTPKKNLKCVAFASPFIFGNKTDINDSGITRIELSHDITCHVPPGFLGYKKFGKVIIIDKNRPWYENIFPWIDEHSPANYEKNIYKYMQ